MGSRSNRLVLSIGLSADVASQAMATTKASGKARRVSTARAPATRAKATTTSRAKTPRVPAVLVNKAMLARYDALLKAFHEAQGTEFGGWDAAYEALDSLLHSEPPLFIAGGYKTAKAFLGAVLPGVALSTVRDGVRVARHFNADDERKYGVRKLALLIDYLEAESGTELPRVRIDLAKTKVDVGEKRVLFTSLSFDEMRDVARKKKSAKGRAGTDAPGVRALRRVFGGSGLGNVAVQCRGERWSLGRIEERQFADLGAALTGYAKKLAKGKPG